ncbi:MAG: pepsin/retropepsin-like aspartic protease family protein [Candidatus Acidiferrales bacterium]
MGNARHAWLTWVAALFLCVACATSGVAKSLEGRAYAEAIDLQRRTIPFRLYGGYMIVAKGSLGPLKDQKLVIDTGTDPSIVDEKAARLLGMRGMTGKLAMLNGSVVVEQSVVPDVSLGPVRVESLPVIIRDLSFLDKALGEHVDAVIGLDVLAHSSFRIDYRSREIVFGRVTPTGAAVPFESSPPFVTVDMRVDGTPVRLLVDTGASALMLFASHMGGQVNTSPLRPSDKATSIAGDFMLRGFVVRHASLSGKELGSLRAFVADDKKGNWRDFDGVVPIAPLGFSEVSFDFDNRTLYFVK